MKKWAGDEKQSKRKEGNKQKKTGRKSYSFRPVGFD